LIGTVLEWCGSFLLETRGGDAIPGTRRDFRVTAIIAIMRAPGKDIFRP
jgi:hypothetical protein